MSKRDIALASFVALAAMTGCGESDRPLASFPPTSILTPTVTATPTAAAAPACQFSSGALPKDTLPTNAPHGAQIPIDHIIVLMQENRSFDSYFGRLPAAGVGDADGLPATASNPASDETPVAAFHQTQYCTVDTNHEWTGSHLEFHDGKNDGFVKVNDPDGARAMGYYDEADLPFYYSLAKTFAISDRYFSSVLGPTYPNRFYLLAGTSFGHVRNDIMQGGYGQRTIFDLLDAQHISWKVYYNDVPFVFLFHLQTPANRVRFDRFAVDAAAGTLPQVAFIDPRFSTLGGPETDEHPPANIQVGQQFVAGVLQILRQSSAWPTSALFLVYDEHGGFYDHVAPPRACVPDGIAPLADPSDPSTTFPAQFDRYGFRVPLVLVSPYAKPGFVSHTVSDHTSILRFIETRFDLPALTSRDANADPMLEMFDFSGPRLLNPPVLPEATIDPTRQQQCSADFPG